MGRPKTDTPATETAKPTTSIAPPKGEREVSEPTPAKPAPIRQDGLQIDGFGLPVNGPARAAVLAELGEEKDPLRSSKDWTGALTTKAREMTEKLYG